MGSMASAVRNVFRGVASLLETGSWQVEEAANQARSAGVLLDRVDEEVEMRAQETLDEVNEALTEYGRLQGREKMLTTQVSDWSSKAGTAAATAKTFKEGTPDRVKWESLIREALTQKAKYAGQLKVVSEAVRAAKPDADRALELVEEIGLTKEQALSERDTLQVANATEQAKLKLARARQTWGKGSGPGQLLREAREKVAEASAQALATEMVEERMPASAERVAAQISHEQAHRTVDKEFTELMAG